MAERGGHRHVANTRNATFQMYQDSASQMIAIKAMLGYKAGFGNKGTKTPFQDGVRLSPPASYIRVQIIGPTGVRTLQEKTYLLSIIRQHFTKTEGRGQREQRHRNVGWRSHAGTSAHLLEASRRERGNIGRRVSRFQITHIQSGGAHKGFGDNLGCHAATRLWQEHQTIQFSNGSL